MKVLEKYVHLRNCTQCGKGMDEGWYDENDSTYYCGKKCLHTEYMPQSNPSWSITQGAIDLKENIFKYETVFYTEWYEDDRWEELA